MGILELNWVQTNALDETIKLSANKWLIREMALDGNSWNH